MSACGIRPDGTGSLWVDRKNARGRRRLPDGPGQCISMMAKHCAICRHRRAPGQPVKAHPGRQRFREMIRGRPCPAVKLEWHPPPMSAWGERGRDPCGRTTARTQEDGGGSQVARRGPCGGSRTDPCIPMVTMPSTPCRVTPTSPSAGSAGHPGPDPAQL